MRPSRRRACGSCQTCGRPERAHRSLQNRRRFRTAPTRIVLLLLSGKTKDQNFSGFSGQRPTDSAEEAPAEPHRVDDYETRCGIHVDRSVGLFDIFSDLETKPGQLRARQGRPVWRRRSETRPVRRSESDPPEGRSFYALCSFRAPPDPWPGGVIGRSSGRAQPRATDARD